MEVILKREKLVSIHDLNKIPYRRDLHDDITIVNIRLQELRALLKWSICSNCQQMSGKRVLIRGFGVDLCGGMVGVKEKLFKLYW